MTASLETPKAAKTGHRGVGSALLVAALILAAGVALLRFSAMQRGAEEQAHASRLAQSAARSLEHNLEMLAEAVEELALRLQGEADAAHLRELAASVGGPVLRQANLFVVPGEPASQGTGAAYPISHALLTDANRSAGRQRMPWPGAALADGEWVAVIRAPLASTVSSASAHATWLTATVPIVVLQQAAMEEVLRAGFDYQLQYRPASAVVPRVLASSTTFNLETPVQQPLHSTGGQWTLLVAPSGGWADWLLMGSHGILVAVFALIGALVTYDAARRPAQLHGEIEERDRRLRAVHQRLAEEIEQRDQLEKRFTHASSHDVFTGLPNRSYLMDRLARVLQRARLQPGYLLAVIVLHLERLKSISEAFGAAAADTLLTQAVRRFEGCLRPEDLVVARLADDEFAMLLFDIGSPSAASAVATRLQDSLAEPFEINGHHVFTTATMGVALASSGYEDADELVRGAHMALSKARAEGLSHYAVFDPATREQVVTRHQLETDLHQAIERREFCLNFQPIVSLSEGNLTGLEVLLRWQHPLEGLVPPARFIPLAEETGLIVPITRWVLREACQQAAAWRSRLPAEIEFYLSVNLSAKDLREPDVCDYVAATVAETRLPAGVLRLEVTESFMIGNLAAVSELVGRFREMGIPLLLDDFGTGYSSLSYLNRIHFDYIKIDRAFVSRLASDHSSDGIVRAIIHLAQDLSSETIAEGVENAESFAHLRELGCSYGQGYYFSKPLEAEATERLLLSRPQWNVPQPQAGS